MIVREVISETIECLEPMSYEIIYIQILKIKHFV